MTDKFKLELELAEPEQLGVVKENFKDLLERLDEGDEVFNLDLEDIEEIEVKFSPDESTEDGFDLESLEIEFDLDESEEISNEDLDDAALDSAASSERPSLIMLEHGAIPGAAGVMDVEEEVNSSRPTNWLEDSDHCKFIEYMINKINGIPKHSGHTTVGCEKAISYLRKADKEISKAIQSDEGDVIDESEAENLRDTIHEFIEQLEEAYDKLVSTKRRKRKKASFSIGKTVIARLGGDVTSYYASIINGEDDEVLVKVKLDEPNTEQVQAFAGPKNEGLTKEARYLVTYVDPFLDSITRLLITSHITHGKDLRDVYAQLNDQYEFTKREVLSIHELLKQKGLPLHVDLGRIGEDNPNHFDGKNIEFGSERYA